MRRSLLLLCIAGAGGGPWLHAQQTADTVYHLHGSVVNGVTGRPIGRALVTSGDRRLATLTNSEGQFALDVSVPPASSATQTQGSPVTIGMYSGPGMPAQGKVTLLAQRPGFLQSRQGANVALDATANTQAITLRLLPSASVRGQVTATGAEGLHGVRVQLLRHAVQDGRMIWQMASTRPVGEDGSFLVADLQPGEYTVATSEWSPRMYNMTAAPSATEQYPPDFLGNTRTLDAATKLHLQYGQVAQANLQLRAVPYYPVTIPVQGLPPNSQANVRVGAGAGFQLYQLGWNNRDSAVEGSLPDGDYTVAISTFGTQRAGALVPLHVAGAAVVHAPAGLVPNEDIPVSVRDERTQANTSRAGAVPLTTMDGASASAKTPGFFLTARPDDLYAGGGGMMQNAANGPVLSGLMPGSYHLQGSAIGGGYIASITSGGANLLVQPFVVNDSGHTSPVEVTLRDDGGTLAGTVTSGDGGVPAARITVLPSDGSGHVLYGYAGSNGKFQIENVPPGSYRVFAMPAENTSALPFLDAAAMRAYDGKGAAVSVSAGQTAQVEVGMVGLDGEVGQP